jgi:hypothetical protein
MFIANGSRHRSLRVVETSSSINWQARKINEKERPVRLPSTSCLPTRPKYTTGWLKIIATLAKANVIRPHSGISRLIVINQDGDSVASIEDSEEDAY